LLLSIRYSPHNEVPPDGEEEEDEEVDSRHHQHNGGGLLVDHCDEEVWGGGRNAEGEQRGKQVVGRTREGRREAGREQRGGRRRGESVEGRREIVDKEGEQGGKRRPEEGSVSSSSGCSGTGWQECGRL
jgi:hypothetical protein